MTAAAKRRTSWLVAIASALVVLAPAAASNHSASPQKTRAEHFLSVPANVPGSVVGSRGTATGSEWFGYGIALDSSVAPRGGSFLDPKSVSDFTLAQRLDLQTKHQALIKVLQQGDVAMPSGAASARLMGELTVATGREVGLIRVGGRRVLRLGDADGIFMADAQRVIAHTHPSGVLQFSGEVGGELGDIPSFLRFQPRQRSSVLIGPDDSAVRLPIPRR